MSKPIALFWDIDGTLLSTARAGVFSLEHAIEQVIGKPLNLQEMHTSGLTDVQIARHILEQSGENFTEEDVTKFQGHYAGDLPRTLPMRDGCVFPNVREILERIDGVPRYYSILLTGNLRMGAEAKLKHYQLDPFFDFDEGAFSDGTHSREEIARNALDRYMERHGDPEKVYVIGDTEHDVNCGKAIDARVIGVATGKYSCEELREWGAWWAIDELPEPDTFFAKLEED